MIKKQWFSFFSKASFGLITALLFCCYVFFSEQNHPIELPEKGSQIEIYSTQIDKDLGKTLTTAIERANHSILLVIYTLTDNEIIQALKEKSEQGLEVSIICDAKASPYVEKRLGPKVKLLKRFARGLMHQKILVVDREFTWLGSANMTAESLHFHGNLMLGAHSNELAELIHLKADSFEEHGKNNPVQHQEFSIGGQKTEMWFLPDDKEAIRKVKQLIRSAQKTIKIAMFTWTRFDLVKAVSDAKLRGVDVKVAIDRNSAIKTSAKAVELLLKENITTQLSKGKALLHHKMMIIDDQILVNGSANWTKGAFTQNDDCFMIVYDLNNKQLKELDRLWEITWNNSTPP